MASLMCGVYFSADTKDDINEYVDMFDGAAREILNDSVHLNDGTVSNMVHITGNVRL